MEDDQTITILEPDGENVVERFIIGKVDNKSRPKKIWITLNLKPVKAIDNLTQ
jgi:hypothetical protein